tara:strand:- start:709 stop:1143 length:435 start_codon:yes stop_codon:yes gene_type:complete
MDKIIKVLKKNNLDETNLPKSINVKIDALETLIKKHNDEVDVLDESENVTEEQEAQIESQSRMIDTNEDVIVDEILSFIEYTNKQNAEKTKLEEANAKAKTDAEELANKNETPKEEKKSGLGWFILGAVVLVATAGVVNVMKNK